jgi:hypothetical protein
MLSVTVLNVVCLVSFVKTIEFFIVMLSLVFLGGVVGLHK